ncbi:sugar ABC transporter ATP-binding protein [Methylobacterium sp. J-048]|uniref:sugar ABC transporter ATP-binding protein n=1 Tax=Methylobacterium sp. J-048 TaxID=2836635 RepID=UPI001FBA58F6|nr:sugar ABC transporter ATP-binding protein [Methylobacterium sp. J-048]MCJ2055080.1 sugar ABC transporter ATP-binding protein [Methylobacterium sp. J-048]
MVLAANNLTKRFGSTRALTDVSFELAAGEVLALMGANGAGKSTLVKILCGVHGADAGSITISGKTVAFAAPRQARAHGIIAVHQSIADVGVPTLSVADNLLLDRSCTGRGPLLAGGRRNLRAAEAIAAGIGLDLDLSRTLGTLSIAERQLVAIARAVAHDPTVLILDEPTASLSAPESERLFTVLDRLRDRGVALLYISHRTGDLRRIADRIVVLRDGRVAGAFRRPLDLDAAIRAMVGHAVGRVARRDPVPDGAPVLRLSQARLAPATATFDLAAHAGEVVAVTGPVGAGKSTLAGAILGRWPLAAGHMELDGQRWRPRSAGEAIRNGVFMAGEDRWRTTFFPGTVPFAHIAGTIGFPFLDRRSRAGLVSPTAEARAAARLIAEFGIKARGPDDRPAVLSGGNQQKVVLARWHAEPARLLLLDEPFQGVDIGARDDIVRAIRAQSRDRATIVFVNDLEEALEVGDRVVVMADRAVVGDAGDLARISTLLASGAPSPHPAAS